MSELLVVNPIDFDESRLVVTDPISTSFKGEDGVTDVNDCSSRIFYLDENGNPCDFCSPFPTQRTFGFNNTYVYTKLETDENLNGMQVCYPINSLNTHNKPTPEEKAAQNMLDAIWRAVVAKGKEEAEKEDSKLPPASVGSYMSARGKMERFIKPILEHPILKNPDPKIRVPDTTKPKRLYAKLITKGKGLQMKALTQVYGPGDKLESPTKYLSRKGEMKQGDIEPVFKFPKVFWGPHGQKSPCGGSVKISLIQCNYSPAHANTGGIPKKRIVGPNSSEPVEEEEDAETHFPTPSRSVQPSEINDVDDGTFPTETTTPASSKTLPPVVTNVVNVSNTNVASEVTEDAPSVKPKTVVKKIVKKVVPKTPTPGDE